MEQVTDFGANPGALTMFKYIPPGLPNGAPLVVVLHGCTQTAKDMLNAGWNQLADDFHFAVVYAQQSTANNPVSCFNWAGEYGDPADMTRGQGENESIAEMVEKELADDAIDPGRVYITGFSAGGAFTAVMLATWPDLFRAGAIMSGVPYRCADSVQGAYNCQQINQHPELKLSAKAWGDLVRQADPGFTGPWPRVSIWHGHSDTYTVHFDNLTELVKQWTNVHGLAADPDLDRDDRRQRARPVRRRERQRGGRVVPDRGHGPRDRHRQGRSRRTRAARSGAASYFEDHGICSTYRVARSSA